MMSSVTRNNDLRDAALAPSTIKTYTKQLTHFLTHSRLTLQQLPSLTAEHIDTLLAAFINHLYLTRAPQAYGAHVMGGLLHHLPHLRDKLYESRLLMRGWKRRTATTSHPPLTWELAVVFATAMAVRGHHAESLGVLLSFDCYLRVGELTSLRVSDVVLPHDARMGRSHTGMALRLARTKTGVNQWVSLRDDAVAGLLELHVRAVHTVSGDTALVFPFSSAHFRRLIRECASLCGMSSTPYVPHSLRHGGATRDYLGGDSIEQVMFRGRWKAMESARIYLQTGRALLAAQSVPPVLNQLGIQIDERLTWVLRLLWTMVPLTTPPVSRPRRARVSFADAR